MNAPDKIYIRPMPNPSDGYVGIAWDKPIPMCETYLRKDALLEWAKEKNTRLDGTGGDYTQGYIHAMIDLIEKLNSM